ncbi:MAG: hypothetical protein ABSE73_09330 [Planctomycetota bacterium]
MCLSQTVHVPAVKESGHLGADPRGHCLSNLDVARPPGQFRGALRRGAVKAPHTPAVDGIGNRHRVGFNCQCIILWPVQFDCPKSHCAREGMCQVHVLNRPAVGCNEQWSICRQPASGREIVFQVLDEGRRQKGHAVTLPAVARRQHDPLPLGVQVACLRCQDRAGTVARQQKRAVDDRGRESAVEEAVQFIRGAEDGLHFLRQEGAARLRLALPGK